MLTPIVHTADASIRRFSPHPAADSNRAAPGSGSGLLRLGRLLIPLCLPLVAGGGCATSSSGWLAGLTPQLAARNRDQMNTPVAQIKALRELQRSGRRRSSQEQQFLVQQLVASWDSEPDPLVRQQILRTACAFDAPQSSEMLQAATRDADSEMRALACELWGQRGGEAAVQALGDILVSDTDVDVRLAAARALGQSKNPAATPLLARALEDPDPAMQYRAVESLREVTGKDLGGDVKAWVAYLDSGSEPPPKSFAQRLTDWF